MFMNPLLDIAPYPRDYDRYRHVREVVVDSVDTVSKVVDRMSDQVPNPDGGRTSMLLWGIIVALAALGICLLMVRTYRKRLVPTT